MAYEVLSLHGLGTQYFFLLGFFLLRLHPWKLVPSRGCWGGLPKVSLTSLNDEGRLLSQGKLIIPIRMTGDHRDDPCQVPSLRTCSEGDCRVRAHLCPVQVLSQLRGPTQVRTRQVRGGASLNEQALRLYGHRGLGDTHLGAAPECTASAKWHTKPKMTLHLPWGVSQSGEKNYPTK